jgi:AcrR family transcriptional regulator
MIRPPAPPSPPRASYHHGDLRAQLIAAVRELVEAQGPEGFSIAEAARRAGVSSAAPYKHFRDRPEILRGVAAEALARLGAAMEAGAAAHPPGTLAAVAAVGLAYVGFARAEPGVFRLVFGLTEGHETDPELMARGQACFGVVVRAAAACLGLSPDDPGVGGRAYMLWAAVHGHAFLTIDRKVQVAGAGVAGVEDWPFLMGMSRAILGPGQAP